MHAKIYIEYYGIVDNNHIYPCLFLQSHILKNDIDSEYNNKVSFFEFLPFEALIIVHVLLKPSLNEIEAIHRNHLWSNGYARSRV